MKQIKLSGKYGQGKVALIDDEDFERVSQYTWRMLGYQKNRAYPVRTVNHYVDGKRKQAMEYLHNFIMGRKDGMMVDHINRDKLDNRKSNLRHCTRYENYVNSVFTMSKTGIRGVSWHKKDKVYRVSFSFKGIKYRVGNYKDLESAKLAYQNKRKELCPDFAPLLT